MMHRTLLIAGRVLASILVAQPFPAFSDGAIGADFVQDQAKPEQSFNFRPFQGTAKSAVGEVGQRQTREQTIGIKPLARVRNRIDSRVPSRMSNRVDRNYDPQASATAAIVSAEDQARTTGSRIR